MKKFKSWLKTMSIIAIALFFIAIILFEVFMPIIKGLAFLKFLF